jgi:predicted transcriptional regulator
MMARTQPSMIDNLLKMSGTLKDYDKAVSLYAKYIKETREDKKLKLKNETIPIAKSAIDSLQRIHDVYKKVNDEVEKEKVESEYPKAERAAYLSTLKEKLIEVQQILKDLQGEGAK